MEGAITQVGRVSSDIISGPYSKPLAVLGLFFVLRKVASSLGAIWTYFLRPSKSFHKHKGKWAVVTGASFGIGYGFALELASRGMNIVLMARSEEKLKEIAKEIEEKYGVQAKVLVSDFGTADKAFYNRVGAELERLEVTMLVNNVGVNTSYPKFFHEHTDEEIENMVQINIMSTLRTTKIVLPQMRARKFGVIINLSSASALEGQGTPCFSVYASTKSFNRRFSMSLSDELERDGIEVLAVSPYFVTSKMTRVRTGNILICTERVMAKTSLDKLGYNMKSVIPWWNHFIQYKFTVGVPFMNTFSMNKIFSLRKRGMEAQARRDAQQKKE